MKDKMQHQIKKKHHYIPKFHLSSWKDESGMLLIYRKDGRGEIESKRKHPSQVCFKNDLYTLKKDMFESKDQMPDHVENELAKIDDNASRVLTELLSECSLSGLTAKERQFWAIYVNSLIQRTPDRLEALEAMMRSIIATTLDDIKSVATPETNHTWETCGKIFNDSNYGENQVRTMLLQVIREEEWVSSLLEFRWQLIRLDDAFPYKFILTECPVVTVGEDNNIGMLALALTPSLLWVAFPNTFDDTEDLGDVIKHIVRIYNGAQVAKKPRFIISSTVLTNDGIHNYDKIFEDYIQHAVGVKQFYNQAVGTRSPASRWRKF